MTPRDNEPLTPETIAELQWLARSRPRSGRGQMAKLAALRELERLAREPRALPTMPDDWHPGGPFEELDRADSVERRQRWWKALIQGSS